MSEGEGQALDLIYLVGALVLVGSALAVRRIPMRQGLKMALAWLLIFGAVFTVIVLKDDFLALGKRVAGAATGSDRMVAEGEMLRIRMAEDGHFWADAEVNGKPVQFLIDSGATMTGLSAATARRVGVEVDENAPPRLVNTANGTIPVLRGKAGTIAIGDIEREDLTVYVSESFGDMDVLGMNFLSSLSGWQVEGQWLILKP